MPTPESLVKALAAGLVEALLAQPAEAKTKREKPTVVKTDDVKAAVRQVVAEMLDQVPQPEQPDLFAQPVVDIGEQVWNRAKIEEARARAEQNGQSEEPLFYNPDMPEGAPWMTRE